MVMVANLQYGWTLFVKPINHKFGWGRPAIQVAFSIFVLCEVWLVPLDGWFVDRFGSRRVLIAGAVLIALAWIADAVGGWLPMLYLGSAIGGIGAGCVYGASMGNALKWFPDRRGLAAGITAAGFGIGSLLPLFRSRTMINSSGYQAAFLWFGIGQGLVILALAPFLRAAPVLSGSVPATLSPGKQRNFSTAETLSPLFWVLYLMMALVSAGGLMVKRIR